jgi:signal transduction histidine kinase
VSARLRGLARLLLVPGVALGVAGLAVALLLEPPKAEPSCRVLPNGRVSVIPDLRARCPLEPLDQIHAVAWWEGGERLRGGPEALAGVVARGFGSISIEVRRHGVAFAANVPVRRLSRAERAAALGSAAALAAALMALPLLLVWRSPAPAAVPFAVFCGAIAMLVFAAASGLRAPWMYRLEAASLVVLPTALVHLALVFPAPRPVLARAPALTRVPWVAGALALAVAWLAFERDALLWPAVCYLLIAVAAVAWCLLLAGAWSDAHASGAALERVRARLLLCATLFLPILPAWLLAELAPHGRHLAAQVLLASLALVPLSVGVAVSRYDLFELRADARRAAVRLFFYTAAAGVGTALTALLHAFAAAGTPHAPLELFASGLACVALADGVRGAWLRQIEGALAPGEARARAARDAYARAVPELRDEADVLRELGAALEEALAPRHMTVFAAEGDALRPLFARGETPCVDAASARAAAAALGPRSWLLVSRAPNPRDPALLALQRRGVELAGALRWRGALVGLALLGTSQRGPFGRAERELLEAACRHAAAALANARLAEELVRVEREAGIGRAAVGLAHDLGKELDWIRRLARRLPSRLADPCRTRSDLEALAVLADDLAETVRGFVRDALAKRRVPSGQVALSDLLDRTVRDAARRFGERALVCVEERARRAAVDAGLRHALAALLDNALCAEPRCGPVHVFAACERGSLRIAVRDHGPGMGAEVLARAFEPGFTTRGVRGGCGAGLAIAREVIQDLGGSVRLEPAEGAGTRAVVELPCARAA